MLDSDLVARLIFRMLPVKGPLQLAIDRTNWQFGKADINIFMLAVVHDGVAYPLERMLDLFRQKYQSPSDYHILNIPNEDELLKDAATERMLTRLRFAAADSRLRRNAEIEEEFASELELKDTEVMQARELARQTIEKAKTRLKAEADAKVAEADAKVAEAEVKTALSIRLLSQHGMEAEQIAGALGVPLERVMELLSSGI